MVQPEMAVLVSSFYFCPKQTTFCFPNTQMLAKKMTKGFIKGEGGWSWGGSGGGN